METERASSDPGAQTPSASCGPRWAQAARWVVAMLLIATAGGVLVARIATAHQVLTSHPQASAVGVRVGQAAPDFSFTPMNESSPQAIHLNDLRGHVVVINFWSPTCSPCHDEAPVLAQAARDDSARGVVFLGVAFESSPSDILGFLRTYHIAYACGQDATSEIAVAYGLVAIPVTVIVDAHGLVTQTIQGAVAQPSLQQAIQRALKNTA